MTPCRGAERSPGETGSQRTGARLPLPCHCAHGNLLAPWEGPRSLQRAALHDLRPPARSPLPWTPQAQEHHLVNHVLILATSGDTLRPHLHCSREWEVGPEPGQLRVARPASDSVIQGFSQERGAGCCNQSGCIPTVATLPPSRWLHPADPSKKIGHTDSSYMEAQRALQQLWYSGAVAFGKCLSRLHHATVGEDRSRPWAPALWPPRKRV